MADKRPQPTWPGDLDADNQRLKDLQKKVAEVRAEDAAEEQAAFDPGKPSTGMGLGLKMGMDLTVATLIGFGLGALLDWPFGTFPLLALILCGLGFMAGIRMVLASASAYRDQLEVHDSKDWDQIPAVEDEEDD